MTHEELLHNCRSIDDIRDPKVIYIFEKILFHIVASDIERIMYCLENKVDEYHKELRFLSELKKIIKEKILKYRKRVVIYMQNNKIEDKTIIENRVTFLEVNLLGSIDLLYLDVELIFFPSKELEIDKLITEQELLLSELKLKLNEYQTDKYEIMSLIELNKELIDYRTYRADRDLLMANSSLEIDRQIEQIELSIIKQKEKKPISSISNTSNQFKKFTYSHIALICHYAKICDSEGKMSLLIHLDIPGKKTITRKLNEKISKFTIKDNRINFEGGNKAGLERQKLLTEVISYLRFHKLKTDEAESDLFILEKSLGHN